MSLTSIKARLLLCLGLLALALAAVGGSGFVALRLSADKTYTIVVDRVIPLDQLKQVADHYVIDIVAAAHNVRSGALSWEDGKKNIDLAMTDIDTQWSAYATSEMADDEKVLADKAQSVMRAAEPAITKLTSILSSHDAAALSSFVDKELYPATNPVDAAIDGLSKLQTKIAREEFDAAAALQGTSLIVMGIIAAASLGILAFATNVVLGGVARPLHAMQAVMGMYANGDSCDYP